MGKELFAKTRCKVVPFEQNGEFFYKKAKKFIENNNYIEALHFYRKAVEKDPDNVEYMMDLAEIFTEMNYFEESNQILFSIIQKDDEFNPDCYFGLGCNFLGLQDYDKAEECFEKYLDLDDEGIYTEEAQDLLDILQNQDYYLEEWGDVNPAQEKFFKMASRGKELLDRGEYKKAVRQLRKVLEGDPTLVFARNNLALAHFCDGQLDQAIDVTRDILKDYSQNIHANCNMALFLYEKGRKEESKVYLREILAFNAEDPEEIHKIAVTLCEIKEHAEANRLLKKLLQFKPYDTKILHYTAVSYFNLKQYRQAISYWNKIDKISPQNTISSFYKKYVQGFLNQSQPFRELPYHFQVPYDEIIRRVRKINDLLKLSENDLKEKWEGSDSLKTLFDWGLDLNDSSIKKAILNVIASFHDDKSERFLRKFILRKNEEDALKKEALALLKQMGASEPYIAYVEDGIAEVKVNIMDLSHMELPPELEEVAEMAVRKMSGRFDGEYGDEVRELWTNFIKALYPDQLPRIRKKEAWAAALELYYCRQKGIHVTKSWLSDHYNITSATLSKNYTSLETVLTEF